MWSEILSSATEVKTYIRFLHLGRIKFSSVLPLKVYPEELKFPAHTCGLSKEKDMRNNERESLHTFSPHTPKITCIEKTASHPAPVQGQTQAPGVSSNGARLVKENCLQVISDFFFLLRCK